jgi:hypothetical protein
MLYLGSSYLSTFIPGNPSVAAVGPEPAFVAGLLEKQSDADEGATEAGRDASTES